VKAKPPLGWEHHRGHSAPDFLTYPVDEAMKTWTKGVVAALLMGVVI
jgi:hypothetical protein